MVAAWPAALVEGRWSVVCCCCCCCCRLQGLGRARARSWWWCGGGAMLGQTGRQCRRCPPPAESRRQLRRRRRNGKVYILLHSMYVHRTGRGRVDGEKTRSKTKTYQAMAVSDTPRGKSKENLQVESNEGRRRNQRRRSALRCAPSKYYVLLCM